LRLETSVEETGRTGTSTGRVSFVVRGEMRDCQASAALGVIVIFLSWSLTSTEPALATARAAKTTMIESFMVIGSLPSDV